MPPGHLPVVSYLAVPVVGRDGEVLGGLFFGHAEAGVFGERAEQLAEGLAAQAAVAVENARLVHQLQLELAARRESEERFRAVWEATSEAMALSDPDGIVLDVNPAYCALYGRRPRELVGHPFAVIFPEAERAEAMEQYRAVFADANSPRSYEARVQRPDGSERIVEARADFLVQDGMRVAMVSAIRDITERRMADAEREAFVDAAAHDLRNPLTSLKGQVQLLQRRAQREERVESSDLLGRLEAIEAATNQMVRLLDEMMDAASLQAGRTLDLHVVPLDLVVQAKAAVDEAQGRTSRHMIRLASSGPDVVVVWDEARLRRVLSNLLDNAIKYSPAGGEIVVGVRREETADGVWAELAVSDPGVGIPAVDLPHLFERFHRGRNVRGIRGTGIGLSGARQIIEQHGGTIAVESVEGRGSTFTVRLPLAGDAVPKTRHSQ
jgi:PAS domain S-box-containing protein